MNNNEQLLTEKIADALWQIWRYWRLTSHPVKQGKITPEQYWVLHILHRFGPQRIKDIAVRMGTGSSAVTIAVKRLERDGLVCRRRGTEDERVVIVYLTEHGQAVFHAWRQERHRVLSALFEPLDGEERRQLYSLLEKVLAHMQKGAISGGSNCRG
ncbi:MarR family winged helix-turn-helix transcriptional regulator [Desulfofundulus thermocisternus]|uniref:MarR family winged helix-turn-helix transcriptional regulator n=1 Tax=Desulfofundulus thermocisternus TaxID=42471 RepID=UPI001A0B9C33|nr:MarR family transcriptional regulator [Desulfofundulus thermocisternus]MBE3586467.1 MarR family transcriptional regulator [Thermoanaerobacter sp.]MCS5696773.1 MarR family transcriptional regulator [Desulfofundulus thermocisternus]